MMLVRVFIIACLLQSFNFLFAAEESKILSNVSLSIGKYLDPEFPQTSFSVLGDLSYRVSKTNTATLLAVVERPFDAYQNWQVPKVGLSDKQTLIDSDIKISLIPSLAVLDLDATNHEGYRAQAILGLQASTEVLSGLTLLIRVSPYAQLNEFRQTTNGNMGQNAIVDNTKYGIVERFQAEYKTGRCVFAVRIYLIQSYSTFWKNRLDTAESFTYELDDTFSLGLEHELDQSKMDGSTGRFRQYSFYDKRESKISAFVGVKF